MWVIVRNPVLSSCYSPWFEGGWGVICMLWIGGLCAWRLISSRCLKTLMSHFLSLSQNLTRMRRVLNRLQKLDKFYCGVLLREQTWQLQRCFVPVVHFDFTSFKKDTTNPEIYKQLYLQLISEYPLSENVFTDGSKTEDGVAAAAVSTKQINKTFTCRLPDDSSIYTAELRAILLALKHVYYSKGKSFLILSDSVSSLQSIFNLKYDHPALVQILDLYTEMTRDGREIVFIWVPSHVGNRGNSAADSAAKDALDGDISVELIPFSDLKSRTNKYILELWQSEWDEFPENIYFQY